MSRSSSLVRIEQGQLWRQGHFTLTPTGLVIAGEPTYQEWMAVGAQLMQLGNGTTWGIGDWLIYGEGRGEWGAMYSQALEVTKRSYQGLRIAAYVSRTFQLFRRRNNLSWSHHQEVAGLDEATQEALLDTATRDGLSHRDLRELVRKILFTSRFHAQHWPPGRYGVIYADPPWQYEHVKTLSRAIENHYPTMTLEAICDLAPTIQAKAADNCVLYLWATSPKLEESLRVVTTWGFTYRTCMVWVKDLIGMGYWARQRHELLLIATYGDPLTPAEDVRPDSVIEAPRLEHSAKPVVVYDLIDTLFPTAPKLELFQREPRPGWDGWGNQAA